MLNLIFRGLWRSGAETESSGTSQAPPAAETAQAAEVAPAAEASPAAEAAPPAAAPKLSSERVDYIAENGPAPVFRFWTCQAAGCSRPSARVVGDCGSCGGHFCAVHIISRAHISYDGTECGLRGPYRDRCQDLRDALDEKDLLYRASVLYGVQATQVLPGYDWGDFDPWRIECNFKISFIDLTTVTLRMVHRDLSPAGWNLEKYNLMSELATLTVLRNAHQIEVPEVDHFIEGECMNGTYPFFGYFMSGLDSEKPIRDTYTRNKILGRQAQQLANIDNIKASKHIGSITFSDEDGKTVIGPTTGDGTRHMPLLGPFDNARDYYVAWCEEHLKLIADRQLCVRFPINAYLIYKYLKKTAEEGRWDNFEGKYENGPFSTKQVEDDDWEPIYSAELTNGIVGPTGWKYARVVPRYEAFGPSLFAVDMKKMQNGEIYENEDDGDLTRYLKKERKSLVKFHGQPDKIRRLMFGLNCGRDIKWEQALQLLRAMNFHLQRKLELRTDWNARWDWEDLRKEWMEEHKYDERLQSLRADVKKKPGLESWNQRDRSILD